MVEWCLYSLSRENEVVPMNVPELTLYVTSKCNLFCEGCIMSDFMSANAGYEMALEELDKFIQVTQESRYLLNIIICGGEPLLWKHLQEGVKRVAESKIANRILLFTNAVNIRNVNNELMEHLSQIRISKYSKNAKNTDELCTRYPDKIRVVDRLKFYRQPDMPLHNVLPCECVNLEHLYMKEKIYACAHGCSRNGGHDELEDGTKLYAPLEIGYLNHMDRIRNETEELCRKCSSNLKVRKVVEKYKKADQYRIKL